MIQSRRKTFRLLRSECFSLATLFYQIYRTLKFAADLINVGYDGLAGKKYVQIHYSMLVMLTCDILNAN